MMKIRIGQGFDVHELVLNRPLVLAGVTIPFTKGLDGHSDADVVIHALIDALLGASSLGDIGSHYSDQDAQYHGIDSRILLRSAWSKVSAAGWRIENIDLTLLAEAPKIAPFKKQMRENLAADLNCSIDQLSLKATTTEKLGFVGRGEGMACLAVALLSQ
jgi:2-C-methyl-D-erythritol 2,4-cyclodiphosphate synthase